MSSSTMLKMEAGGSPTKSPTKVVEYGPNFNAPIYPSRSKMLHDRTWVVLAQSAQIMYLGWRWHRFITLPSSYWISIPFLLSETLIIVGGSFITYFLVWNQITRPQLRLKNLHLNSQYYPTVDIMIPCYNEPVEIVKKTTLAVLTMDYPTDKMTICICDDGTSAAMRAMVAELTSQRGLPKGLLRYIARKKIPGVPHHAKAGNINNAMMNESTNGEFIVIFDCDMECKPHFLQTIIPHFLKYENDSFVTDETIAMVQTPQAFTNVPEDDPLGQQYRYFYGPVLRGWDAVGSTPCCGTNVVFSRQALLSIGGFTYGSITEDFLTSMTLHSHGFNTKYVHEYLAFGLSPENVHDFYKQRMRWSAGGLQIFVQNNALFKRGLKPTQRFLYFWSGLNTFFSIPMIFLTYCPIIYLLGMGSFKVATFDTFEYFAWFTPYMVLQVICMSISYQGVPSVYMRRSFQESVFMLYCYARAVLTVCLGLKLGFKVTSKDADQSDFRKSFNWIIPFLVYYIFALLSMASAGFQLYRAYLEPQHSPPNMISLSLSLFWIFVIMWQSWAPIGVALKSLKPRRRETKPNRGSHQA